MLRHGRVSRMLAVVFLAVVCLDLTDTRCDAIRPPANGTQVVSVATAGNDDACSPVCLPDCFCCSAATSATVFTVQIAVTPIALPVSSPRSRIQQPPSPPYHPPQSQLFSI
jgi:hypothetical protein